MSADIREVPSNKLLNPAITTFAPPGALFCACGLTSIRWADDSPPSPRTAARKYYRSWLGRRSRGSLPLLTSVLRTSHSETPK